MTEKPGYKTTEFWLSLAAMLVGALFAAGVVPVDGPWAQVAGIVASILGALGYQVSRTVVKKDAAKVAIAQAVSKNPT